MRYPKYNLALPQDNNLNSSSEYNSRRCFTTRFPQNWIMISRYLAVKTSYIPTEMQPMPGTKMCSSVSAGDDLHMSELTVLK